MNTIPKKADPLDPYQNYHFQDQGSPISETNLIKERQALQNLEQHPDRSKSLLILIGILAIILILGVIVTGLQGWIKF